MLAWSSSSAFNLPYRSLCEADPSADRADVRSSGTLLPLQRGCEGAFAGCTGTRKPYVDEAGSVHWPLLFVYPETMQMDAVEDTLEGDTLADHLDAMFSAEAPPLQWDTEHAYTRSNIEAHYLSHAAQPLSTEQLTEVRNQLHAAVTCLRWQSQTRSMRQAGTEEGPATPI